MNPIVHVLLSTYNGERFLRKQIDSLLSQSYGDIVIHVRDDGSSDNTRDIIQSYMHASAPIQAIFGEHVGVVRSFMWLLESITPPQNDLFAFCDQDDIWAREKLSRAVSAIMGSEAPAKTLYFSRLRFIDDHGTITGTQPIPKYVGFDNAIVENVVTGCTTVFGSDLRKIMLRSDPANITMHDHWLYLVGSAFGTLIYDSTPSIDYRLHTANAVGFPDNVTRLRNRACGLLDRLRRVGAGHRGPFPLRAVDQFLSCYLPDLPPDKHQLAANLLRIAKNGSLSERARYLSHLPIHVNNKVEAVGLYLILLLKLY